MDRLNVRPVDADIVRIARADHERRAAFQPLALPCPIRA